MEITSNDTEYERWTIIIINIDCILSTADRRQPITFN